MANQVIDEALLVASGQGGPNIAELHLGEICDMPVHLLLIFNILELKNSPVVFEELPESLLEVLAEVSVGRAPQEEVVSDRLLVILLDLIVDRLSLFHRSLVGI